MRVLVVVGSFPPDTTSTASLYGELADDLAAAGHDVAVVTEGPSASSRRGASPRWFGTFIASERSDAMVVWRVSRLLWMSRIPGGSAMRYLLASLLYVLAGLRAGPADVLLLYSPPLNLAFAAYLIARLRRVPLVFNLQDIHPKVLVDLGFVRNRMIIRVLEGVERLLYRDASHFIVYSRDNAAYLERHGVPAGQITIVPNWVDTAVVAPGPKANDFRKRHGLEGKFVVSYAGTIGKAQHLEAVVEAARSLEPTEDIEIVLVGDGDSRAALESWVAARNLGNVRFLPFQPKHEYVNILNASDICLLPLNKDTPPETVPGKLPQLMAGGRAILAAVPPGGYLESIIASAGCGVCVPPGDSSALGAAILALRDDPGLAARMGANGRVYAEREYARVSCTARYLQVMRKVARSAA